LKLIINYKKKNELIYKYSYYKYYYLSDIIRSYIYNIYNKEIPYSCEIYINNIYIINYIYNIYITIYLERISQKIIFIGYKGNKINYLSNLIKNKFKKIYNIKNIYLKFNFVIIKWKNNKNYLKMLGY
ncbi:MAG: hypothetical protein NHG00_00005, partial [Candidatus Shikimatogenerans sp. JK-2022]|nr:hypothetical protein [Candidatus Shikimatogenerans bostrichidophilus]